jgi:hypothetical protein
MNQTSRRYSFISAAFAFVLWGGWAYYINNSTGLTTQWISAFTQGLASFTITLVMVKSVTSIYWKFSPHAVRLILPTVLTVSATGTAGAMAHLAVGTPRILATLTPVLIVAFSFCLFTTWKLYCRERNTSVQQATADQSPPG